MTTTTGTATKRAKQTLIDAAEIAYSELAFTLQDIVCTDRRKDEDAWIERRGRSIAVAADNLRAAIDAETRNG